jgi:hypothetical protein
VSANDGRACRVGEAMTRRDYVLVAKVIAELPKMNNDPMKAKHLVREAFVTEFLKDKPTFNADAFRKSCGER